MAGGRPSTYNQEIAALICKKVATSTCGLKKLCADNPELPDSTTINEWRFMHEEFGRQYAQAKKAQMDLLAEEIIDISDDDSRDITLDKHGNEVCNQEFVARSRLRMDSRKWLAAKLMPKVYGDRPDDDNKAANTLIEKLLEKL